MKKILMGLVAVTTVAFSDINLSTPAAGSNVFEFGGQEGKINISLTVKSKLTPVKYVMFVDDNGTWEGTEEDTLTLPEILLSQAPAGNKFGTDVVMKNVYVKAVSAGNKGVEEIAGGKVVKFSVILDKGYTALTSTPFRNGQEFLVPPTALMAKGTLETLVGGASATVNESGLIEKDGKFYRTPNNIRFFSDANGVLKVEMKANSSFSSGDTMEFTDATTIQNLFTAEKAFNTVKITATVN